MQNDAPVMVYKLNPDGTKGKLVKTMVAFPQGWDDRQNLTGPASPEVRRGRKEAPAEYYRRLYDQGKGDREIGRLTGRSERTIRLWRSKEGLPTNGRGTNHG